MWAPYRLLRRASDAIRSLATLFLLCLWGATRCCRLSAKTRLQLYCELGLAKTFSPSWSLARAISPLDFINTSRTCVRDVFLLYKKNPLGGNYVTDCGFILKVISSTCSSKENRKITCRKSVKTDNNFSLIEKSEEFCQWMQVSRQDRWQAYFYGFLFSIINFWSWKK